MIVDTINGNLITLFDEGLFFRVAHGCNTLVPMGRGIAKSFVDRWPEVQEENLEYKAYWESLWKGKGFVEPFKRFCGTADPVVVDRKCGAIGVIWNLYTQRGVGYPVEGENRLEYIREAFSELNEAIALDDAAIGIPLIGSGLAKGKWEDIRAVINEVTPDIEIVAVRYAV